MTEPVVDEIRRMVADVFNCPFERVTPESTSETIEGWDSLHHLNLIIAVEQRYGISFDPWEAADLVSVEAIVRAVEERRA